MSDIRPDIIAVRQTAVGRLAELHDDFRRTELLWQEVLVRHRYGIPSLSFQNVKTGGKTATPGEWTQSARQSLQRLRIRTFKEISNELELFLGNLLRVWLRRFPGIVDAKSIPLSEILLSNDLTDIQSRATREAVESTILGKLKEKPLNWFTYVREHCGFAFSRGEVERFVERKAARDVLEHHDGQVDPSYVQKAATAAVYKAGDLVEPTDSDLDDLYDLTLKLILQIAGDAERYFPKASA
jgi:hypothetical protein